MSAISKPGAQPFRILTVNKVPERAYRLVGRIVNDLQRDEKLLLEHVGNCASIDEVSFKVESLHPDILMCASMWTPEESAKVFKIGRDVVGDSFITHAIPQGMQVEKGPDFVVEYLKTELPKKVEAAMKEQESSSKL